MQESQISYKIGLLEGRFDGLEDLLREAIQTAKDLSATAADERLAVVETMRTHKLETDARITSLESDNKLWRATAGAVFATFSFLFAAFWGLMTGFDNLKKFMLWLFSSTPIAHK